MSADNGRTAGDKIPVNKIDEAFSKGKAFIAFVTAGDPSIEATAGFVLAMEKAGADIIELGIPFSDPVAEGVVIQEANIRALEAGARVEKIFELVEKLRQKTEIPLVFLTYFNPVFRYKNTNGGLGVAAFFERCKNSGVNGVIIPDLPFEEQGEARGAAEKSGVALISLIAPTSEDRIASIARESSRGFLYIVSSLGVTGVRGEIKTDIKSIIEAAKKHTKTPCAVGFGINTPEQAAQIAKVADGVIVGSAIVKIIAAHGANAAPHIVEYVQAMKNAMR